MRKTGFWMGLMLAAGLATTVSAAEPRDDDEEDTPAPAKSTSSWWPGWMRFGGKTEKKEPAPKSVAATESPSAVRAREMEDWLRRVAVCTRLHQIAAETNDDDLDRQADELEQRAFAIYQQRTAALPSGPMDLEDERDMPVRRRGADARTPGRIPRAGAGRTALQED